MKKEAILEPSMVYVSLKMELTYKKIEHKFKIFVKFWDVNILRIASLAHLLRYGVNLLLEFLFLGGLKSFLATST